MTNATLLDPPGVLPRPPHPAADEAAPDDFPAVARSLSSLIRDDADAAEQRGGLTPEVADALRSSGLYWMLVPTELGGGGADLHATIDVIEALSAADGATGWSFMANAVTTGFAAAYVGDVAADEMFGGTTMGLTAGMLAPAGRATVADGGFNASGRYGFGSGCEQADWMGGGFIVTDGGRPVLDAHGVPLMRIGYVPRDRVEFIDNWDVSGLHATGSHDYVIAEQFIGDDFTVNGSLRTPDHPRRGDLFRIGLVGCVSVSHAAFALGIMRRALHEVARIAVSKTRLGYESNVAANETFRREFAVHEASYRAGRAHCHDVFGAVQQSASSGEFPSDEQVARMRVTTTWLTQTAADVVRFCHMWAGSEAIRHPSALGRCTRDVLVATQHIMVDPASIAQHGAPLIAEWATDDLVDV